MNVAGSSHELPAFLFLFKFNHVTASSWRCIVAKDFLMFLKEYQVIGLAIAVIIGGKVNELVKAIVDQLIMPIVGLVVPGGDWRSLTMSIGETKFGVGIIMGASLDFLIIAVLIYLFAKHVLKEERQIK